MRPALVWKYSAWHRHSDPVHFDVQDGNRPSQDHRQMQLHRPADLLLVAAGNNLHFCVGAHRVCMDGGTRAMLGSLKVLAIKGE